MSNRTTLDRGICLFVLIFCAKFIIASDSEKCENHDDLYVIRSVGTFGLVLDATEPEQVRAQHFTGSETQLWKFKPGTRPGFYYIINEHHRKVLDFILADDGRLHATVSDMKHCLQQQWNFGLKGHIANAVNEKNIDIHKANFNPGTKIIIWENNGCSCQRFLLQKKV